MFTFLLIIHAFIAAGLVTVILVQKSEGGGLTTGGSPSGLMSARGAADFLTRTTSILASAFVGMSILLAVLAATNGRQKVDASQATGPAPSQSMSLGNQADDAAARPFGSGLANAIAPVGNATAPVDNGAVPLAR